MTRHRMALAASLGLAVCLLASAGCDNKARRQALRAPDPDPVAADASFQPPQELNGFFKPRSGGAWSSEARDIEKSLGAGG